MWSMYIFSVAPFRLKVVNKIKTTWTKLKDLMLIVLNVLLPKSLEPNK